MYPITSGFVRIVDDIVGMIYLVDPARSRITIWNWKTGNRMVVGVCVCAQSGVGELFGQGCCECDYGEGDEDGGALA